MNYICHIWHVNVREHLLTLLCVGSEMSERSHLFQELGILSFLYTGYVSVMGFHFLALIGHALKTTVR